MIQNDFNKIIDYCTLTKNDTIKNEVIEILKGYRLYDINLKEDVITCYLNKDKENDIKLSVRKDSIEILKNNPVKQELIKIHSNLDMSEKSLEKRPNGVIFSVVTKSFKDSSIFKNKTVLSNLIEQRYTFTDDTLSSYFKGKSFSQIFEDLVNYYENADLESIMDYNSTFEIHTSLSRNPNTGLLYENFHTFLNGEDLGNIYNISNSPNKVYRIYDLYNGLITPRNESDIDLIHDEFLSDKGFNLRELKDLTFEENNLVGPTIIPVSQEYYQYVKTFLKEKYGYFGEIAFDRETLLSAITYKMSASELVKKDIARILGMTYEDFIMLDILEQQKLVEQVTHKKIKQDTIGKEGRKIEKKNFNVSSITPNERKENPLKKVLKIFKK